MTGSSACRYFCDDLATVSCKDEYSSHTGTFCLHPATNGAQRMFPDEKAGLRGRGVFRRMMGGFFSKSVQFVGPAIFCQPDYSARRQFEEGVAVLPKTRSIVTKCGDLDPSQKRRLSPERSGVNDRVFGVTLMKIPQNDTGAAHARRRAANLSVVPACSSTDMVKEV